MFSKTKEKICDPRKIANLFSDYYQDLYNLIESDPKQPMSPEKIDYFLSKISLPKLSQPQLEILNKPITIQETQKVLKSSKL